MKRFCEFLKNILISMLKLYKRIISPILPPVCRFYPTCSDYAIEAITTYGILKGLWLSLNRILRCHPFHKCDYDPVPKKH